MTAKVFETALGIAAPWSVASVEFDEGSKVLTVQIDFKPGSRFAVSPQGFVGAGPEAVHHRSQGRWGRSFGGGYMRVDASATDDR